jgi:hypothetical protein
MTMTLKAHQHFTAAVESLACGAGPIRERLCDAAGHLAPLEMTDIPEDLRPHFETLRQVLRSSDATTHSGALNEGDASSLARSILDLKESLAQRTTSPRRMA